MVQSGSHLIWLDMEMTGLEPERDRIIELAMIVTDDQLNIVTESPVWVVHQTEAVLDAMDDWNKGTHGKSGLIERVRASTLDEAAVEAAITATGATGTPGDARPTWAAAAARSTPALGSAWKRALSRFPSLLEDDSHGAGVSELSSAIARPASVSE